MSSVSIDVPGFGRLRFAEDDEGDLSLTVDCALDGRCEIDLRHIPSTRGAFWLCGVGLEVFRGTRIGIDDYSASVNDPDRDTALRHALGPFAGLVPEQLKAAMRGEP